MASTRDDDFGERLKAAMEAYQELIGSQNSMTERHFQLGHRGDGTCPKCSNSYVRANIDEINGASTVVCTSCGYRGPRGKIPNLPGSPWFTREV